jgi:GMP synthase (glutamine-hydrolysing)
VRHNGTVRPFLLIATRPEDTAAQGEYEAMLRFTGLTSEQVRYVQLDRAPLPEIDLEELSGVIVGGSPYTTSDPPQKKSAAQVRVEEELGGLLDRVVAADFPFFGARGCGRGHRPPGTRQRDRRDLDRGRDPRPAHP